MTEIMILGAGPYGLSLAAHLRSLGVPYRIFGRPMLNWATKMPRGMRLKHAGNLSAPNDAFNLNEYSARRGIRYDDETCPLSIEDFIAYGEAFQQQFVPDVDPRFVVRIERRPDGFTAELDDGEVVAARRVVVAIGISDFPYAPPELAAVPGIVSHAAQHCDMTTFRGREVVIVGAGSTATDIAALMHEAGTSVTLVSRQSEPRFHSRGNSVPSLGDRLLHPPTGIGPGWRNVFFTRTPNLYRLLPPARRLHWAERTHGPAGGWFIRDRVVGKVAILGGFVPTGIAVKGDRAEVNLAGLDGTRRTVSADHVIAATGYRVDLARLAFLPDAVRRDIALLGPGPELSAHFESSVRGLYFVGPVAKYSFGPAFRFVAGVEWVAPRLARHLAATAPRRSSAPGAAFAEQRRAA